LTRQLNSCHAIAGNAGCSAKFEVAAHFRGVPAISALDMSESAQQAIEPARKTSYQPI